MVKVVYVFINFPRHCCYPYYESGKNYSEISKLHVSSRTILKSNCVDDFNLVDFVEAVDTKRD